MADCLCNHKHGMTSINTTSRVQGNSVLNFIVHMVFVETETITETPVRLSWPDYSLLEFLPVFSMSVLQSKAYVHTVHP